MKSCPSCDMNGPPCGFGANRARKDGLSVYCRDCQRTRGRVTSSVYREKNPGMDAKRLSENRANPEYLEAERARARVIYWSNPDKLRAKARATTKRLWRKWFAQNPERWTAQKAKYRANLLNATPAWSDFEAIKLVYAEARRVSSQTGVAHHVDHMVPLKGKNVCGLHVSWNLQLLTSTENQSKGNKLLAAA